MKRVGSVDVSYLAPRDPSILSRDGRPMPRKRNLTFGEDITEEDLSNVKVFLRCKPQTVVEVGPEVPSFKIVGSDLLCTTSWIRHKQVVQQFRFTAVLPERASQRLVFDSVARRPLQSLVDAQRSGLIFTYGTTNAGKTHTMFGDETNPGLIPLSLSAIFSSLEDSLIVGPTFKPGDGGVAELDDEAQNVEAALRAKLLEWDPKLGEDTYSMSMLSNCPRPASATEPALPRIALHAHLAHGQRANVWVSCVEVYQEQAFDLLASSQQSALTVRGDSVRGLTLVCVSSAAEAQRLLLLARHRLRSAATGLNLRSSRSHCVFSVRIAVAAQDKPLSQMQFDFVDLAGSERADKTGNRGLRLVESSKINQSLSVLGRCLKAMRANQKGGSEMVPFRDSLLTRLLKTPLVSQAGETVSLLVCASAEAKTFSETCKALEFASVARRVQLRLPPPAPSHAAPSRFSLLAVARPTHNGWLAAAPRDATAQACRECMQNEENTAARLSELETRLRKELVQKFAGIIKEEQERHSRDLDAQERRLMELVKHREEHMLATLAAQEQQQAPNVARGKRARAETIDLSDSEDEDGELNRVAADEIIQLREELSAAAKAVADAEFRAAHAELCLREVHSAAADDSGKSLEAAVQQLNGLLDEARTDLLQYRTDVEDLRQQLQDAKEDAALKEIQLDDATASVEELRACLDARPKTRARSQDQDAQRRTAEEIVALEASQAELLAKLSAREAGEKDAAKKVTSLEAGNRDLLAKVSELESTESQLRAQISAFETSETRLQAQITELQTKEAELQAKISGWETKETELQAQVLSFQTSGTVLRAKISSLESSETELQAKISTFGSTETELRAKISAFESTETELRAKISTLESTETELRARISTLESTETELQRKILASDASEYEIVGKMSASESALAARDAEVAQLRESVARCESELATLRQQAIKVDCKESDLEIEVKRLLQQQMALTEERNAICASLRTTKAAVTRGDETARSLRSENEALAASMEQQRRESDERSARAASSFAQLEDLLRRERENLALAKRDCAAATQQLYRLTPARRPRSLSLGNPPGADGDDAKENSAVGANLGPPDAPPQPQPRSSKRLTRRPGKAVAPNVPTSLPPPKKSTRKLFVQEESYVSPEPSPETKTRTRSHRK